MEILRSKKIMDKIEESTEQNKSVYKYLIEAEKNFDQIISRIDEISDILDVITTEYPQIQSEPIELKKAAEPTTLKGLASSINYGSYSIIEKLNKIVRLINRELREDAIINHASLLTSRD